MVSSTGETVEEDVLAESHPPALSCQARTAATLTLADPALVAMMDAFSGLRRGGQRLFDRLCDSVGITPSDYRALFVIGHAEQATLKQVATALDLTAGAVTTLIDRIEAAGLVRRLPHPTDRRSVFVELTVEGCDAVTDGWTAHARIFTDVVPAHQHEMLTRLMHELSDRMTQVSDSIPSGP